MPAKSLNYDDYASLIKKAKEAGEKAARATFLELQKSYPNLNEDMGISIDARVYKKQPPGFSKILYELAQRLCWVDGLTKTQKQLNSDIKPMFPKHVIRESVWSKKFTKWEYRRIKTIIEGAGKTISLKGCRTLSELKSRLCIASAKEQTTQILRPVIQITKDVVLINGTICPIEKRKSGNYTYNAIRITVESKRQWLRLDVLLSAFSKK